MTKVLFVIDYINGIAKTGTCAEYLAENPNIVANTNVLIDRFRMHGLPIFFIRLAFDESYNDLPKFAPTADTLKTHQKFLLDGLDSQFIPELNFIEDTDMVFNKKYGDPFYGSNLLIELGNLNVEEIVFTGLATDNAILYGAQTAMVNNYRVTIISDACGASSTERHEQGLVFMKGKTANEITTTDDFINNFNLNKNSHDRIVVDMTILPPPKPNR